MENILKDPEHNVTFKVISRRKLSIRELVRTVNGYARKHRTPVRGSTVTIRPVGR